jgi:phage repressor protein C with HTH and peptisase S24 domain
MDRKAEKEARAARLRDARRNAGYSSAVKAAERFGWPVETYKAHESGRNGFDNDAGRKYAKGFDVSVAWLMTGANAGDGQASSDDDVGDELVPAQVRLVEAPVIGVVEAGSFREVFAVDNVEPEMVVVPPDPRFPHARLLVFHVAGDSMNDLRPRPILPGDRIVTVSYEDVAHEVPLRDGMTVVVQRTRDGGHMREWSVKQLELYEDHVDFCPRSTNPRHRPIRVSRDAFADGGTEVEIIAVVRQVMNTIPL